MLRPFLSRRARRENSRLSNILPAHARPRNTDLRLDGSTLPVRQSRRIWIEGTAMKIRAVPLAVIATLAAASWAQAAVTVLGNGVAHSCYQFAEYAGNP